MGVTWRHPHTLRAHADDALVMTDIAMAAALSAVLGQLRLLQLPFGGSITIAMLPIVLLALVRGWRPALLAGLAAGAVHALLGGTILHPIQIVLDYGLAWAVLAVAGVLPHRTMDEARVAIAVAGIAHLLVFTASGIVFFGEYAGSLPVAGFSLVYNAAHVVPETVLAIVLLPTAARAWARARPAQVDPPNQRSVRIS